MSILSTFTVNCRQRSSKLKSICRSLGVGRLIIFCMTWVSIEMTCADRDRTFRSNSSRRWWWPLSNGFASQVPTKINNAPILLMHKVCTRVPVHPFMASAEPRSSLTITNKSILCRCVSARWWNAKWSTESMNLCTVGKRTICDFRNAKLHQ